MIFSSTFLSHLAIRSDKNVKIYEYTPQKNVKKLGLITGLLLLGAVILIIIQRLMPNLSSPWMFQLLAVGMLMLVIFITARYIMKSYVYAIIDEDGSVDLTVTEIQGRHVITVCRISLSGLESVVVAYKGDPASDNPVKNKIRADKRKSFNYCSDFFDEKYICIFSDEGGTAVAVKLSWDEKLEKLIEEYLVEDDHTEQE